MKLVPKLKSIQIGRATKSGQLNKGLAATF